MTTSQTKKKHHHPCKKLHPHKQPTTMAKEREQYIRCQHGKLRRRRNMRASWKLPPLTVTAPRHQRWTLPRRRTCNTQHNTPTNREHKERNMRHLQQQWTTNHHRSKQAHHQLPQRHPKLTHRHLKILHKARHDPRVSSS